MKKRAMLCPVCQRQTCGQIQGIKGRIHDLAILSMLFWPWPRIAAALGRPADGMLLDATLFVIAYCIFRLIQHGVYSRDAQCLTCGTVSRFTPAETPRKTPASPEAPPPAYRVRT